MTAFIKYVTFDCADRRGLSAFLVRSPATNPSLDQDDFVALAAPDHRGVRGILFCGFRNEKPRRAEWHVDLATKIRGTRSNASSPSAPRRSSSERATDAAGQSCSIPRATKCSLERLEKTSATSIRTPHRRRGEPPNAPFRLGMPPRRIAHPCGLGPLTTAGWGNALPRAPLIVVLAVLIPGRRGTPGGASDCSRRARCWRSDGRRCQDRSGLYPLEPVVFGAVGTPDTVLVVLGHEVHVAPDPGSVLDQSLTSTRATKPARTRNRQESLRSRRY